MPAAANVLSVVLLLPLTAGWRHMRRLHESSADSARMSHGKPSIRVTTRSISARFSSRAQRAMRLRGSARRRSKFSAAVSRAARVFAPLCGGQPAQDAPPARAERFGYHLTTGGPSATRRGLLTSRRGLGLDTGGLGLGSGEFGLGFGAGKFDMGFISVLLCSLAAKF